MAYLLINNYKKSDCTLLQDVWNCNKSRLRHARGNYFLKINKFVHACLDSDQQSGNPDC